MDLIDVFKTKKINDEVKVEGWIRNHRPQKEFGFIDFFDGTSFNSLQVVYEKDITNFEEIKKLLVGSSIIVKGFLVESRGKQNIELHANSIEIISSCDDTYPVQPKKHTMEFLRTIAHLRPRTRTFQAVFKIRNLASYAIHKYFQDRNYTYVHTPLITTSDCEGENQMFKLTTFDLNNVPKTNNIVDYTKDLFNKPVFITGTGQLHGEAFSLAFKKIYTFGPTFRTENSNTKTHANEFWMIEPEIAFCNLDELMNIEEEMLKYIVKYVLDNGKDEIDFCDKFIQPGLKEKLEKLVSSKFIRITHKEAIDILKKSKEKFEFEPNYEEDIAKEHEKYITEYFDGPVFIKNWPKDIKAFYMKLNDDNKTVAAVDLEVPGTGELMGGSEREINYDVLMSKIKDKNIDKDVIDWYISLRKFGNAPHAGFGMGFERLIIYLTGMENIRDVIPFPRTPGNCEY